MVGKTVKRDVLIAMGDLNARVGKQLGMGHVLGSHREAIKNDNGDWSLQFSSLNKMLF